MEQEQQVVYADQQQLVEWLSDAAHEGQPALTRLKTSERVLARVTDGIYRQPSSALRELISNAWDADARNVTITTDAPRFQNIVIRDDGSGMDYRTLTRLLHMIGGSSKRREEGQELGVTSAEDAELTPAGRQLIGKIGIGLFSVSQLARAFRIITKVKGNDYHLVADVRLRAYSEDPTDDTLRDESDEFVSGEVYVTREHREDAAAHGTDIYLDDIKPRVRELLRSADRWRAIAEREQAIAAGDSDTASTIAVAEPNLHIGWIGPRSGNSGEIAEYAKRPHLPWTQETSSGERMALLMDAVEQIATSQNRPDLANTLDSYLQTIWELGLSSPVDYVETHPFDLPAESGLYLFWLANEGRAQSVEVSMLPGETVRQAVAARAPGHPILVSGSTDPAGGFKVVMDGVEIRRPIRFHFVQPSRAGLDKPMMFVGRYSPDLARVSASQRGGSLEVEGYLFWNGRVVPKENNGLLVRIRGTSGALFDEGFFKYQVSEQTRLRQITSELFVPRGLDAALNIDRESFNFAHPHVQLVTGWVHRALRQLTNQHKYISQRLREERHQAGAEAARSAVNAMAAEVWRSRRGLEPQPEVSIAASADQAVVARRQGYYALTPDVLGGLQPTGANTDLEVQNRVAALVTVLSAFGVLEDRPYEEGQALIRNILQIFS